MYLIWYFIAGFISGAVGAVLVIWTWFKANVRQVSKEEILRDLQEMEEHNNQTD